MSTARDRWPFRFLAARNRRSLTLVPWLALACGLPLPLIAQSTVRLSGYVRSAETGEVIRYARISAEGGSPVESNQDGFFVLTMSSGRQIVRVRAVGFMPLVDTITVEGSTTREFRLTPRPLQLDELAVVSTRADTSDIDPATPEMSTVRLDSRTVKLTPVVLGEADPIRTLFLMPGVKPITDFSTGFSVRGGAPDQNLILLDESTIYNPSHIFGFFSVFNSDAIDDVKLYKGALPARFGGRLSSVLDVRQREGNANQFAGQATLGMLASRALIEGPLPDKIGSYLIAGRRTYADLFLKLASDPDLRKTTAYFYDLNAKANVRLGATGTLMASGYLGRDRFRIPDRFAAGWGNASGTVRWNQAIGNRLFSKVTLTASDYDYGIEFLGNGRDFSWVSRIGHLGLQINEQFTLGNGNLLEFGGELTRHALQPGQVTPVGDSPINAVELPRRVGLSPALHLSHEMELASWLSIRYGARLAGFRLQGPATVYQYQGGQPLRYDAVLGRYERATPIDSTVYRSGTPVASFGDLEPRASVRIGMSRSHSLKASYTRTRQYLHLISNTNTQTPVDVWEPVGPYVKPQRADQVALGYVGTFGGEALELSIEGYYKWLDRVTDLVDGADITLNDRLETEILQGKGRAYGVEMYARRRTGKLTGWVSYTLSRTERRVPGLGLGDPGLNDGKWYPSPYDRTHDLSVVGFYPLGRKWTLGSTFSLSSGLPATLPNSRYQYGGLLLAEYGPRNGSRVPPYHRLDITFTRTSGRKEWQFGLFNVYNRFNAQSISFRPTVGNPLALEAIQSSVFGIVPSVNFSVKF